jgi:hypothetical protein
VSPRPNNLGLRRAFQSILLHRAALPGHFLGNRHERAQGPERLLLLQEIFEGAGHGASTRMADRLGITLHRWSNVLRGSPLSIGLAQRIILTFPGVSLDWLYFGRPQGLSCQMAEKLGHWAAHFQPGAAELKTSQEQRRSPALQTTQ